MPLRVIREHERTPLFSTRSSNACSKTRQSHGGTRAVSLAVRYLSVHQRHNFEATAQILLYRGYIVDLISTSSGQHRTAVGLFRGTFCTSCGSLERRADLPSIVVWATNGIADEQEASAC
jgi:hypothetical protein